VTVKSFLELPLEASFPFKPEEDTQSVVVKLMEPVREVQKLLTGDVSSLLALESGREHCSDILFADARVRE